jgi:hypothetical protein
VDRKRVLVPFDIAFFLKAPYAQGYLSGARRRQHELSRHEKRVMNAGLMTLYALMAVGGIVGWRVDHSWLAVGIGVLVGSFAACPVFLVGYGVVAVLSRAFDGR